MKESVKTYKKLRKVFEREGFIVDCDVIRQDGVTMLLWRHEGDDVKFVYYRMDAGVFDVDSIRFDSVTLLTRYLKYRDDPIIRVLLKPDGGRMIACQVGYEADSQGDE